MLLLTEVASTAQTREDFVKAEQEIKRLPPSAFKELAPAIVKELQERGCTIPQTAFISEPHNVIEGEFARKGQKDWAVFCSREGESSILVFWGGPAKCHHELKATKDLNGLQNSGENKIVYSLSISLVDKKYILEHYETYGGPKPPPIDHQGINYAFLGKSSELQYCHEGQWLTLTGAD